MKINHALTLGLASLAIAAPVSKPEAESNTPRDNVGATVQSLGAPNTWTRAPVRNAVAEDVTDSDAWDHAPEYVNARRDISASFSDNAVAENTPPESHKPQPHPPSHEPGMATSPHQMPKPRPSMGRPYRWRPKPYRGGTPTGHPYRFRPIPYRGGSPTRPFPRTAEPPSEEIQEGMEREWELVTNEVTEMKNVTERGENKQRESDDDDYDTDDSDDNDDDYDSDDDDE